MEGAEGQDGSRDKAVATQLLQMSQCSSAFQRHLTSRRGCDSLDFQNSCIFGIYYLVNVFHRRRTQMQRSLCSCRNIPVFSYLGDTRSTPNIAYHPASLERVKNA